MKTTTSPTRTHPHMRLRSGLRAGNYPGCKAYCGQEYRRCLTDGTPTATCEDRLPVCQNACTVCGVY